MTQLANESDQEIETAPEAGEPVTETKQEADSAPESNQAEEAEKAQDQETETEQEKTSADQGPKENSVMKGEDALSLVSPLSDLAFYIATANQKPLKCRSKYVGMHSHNYVLFETPDITQEQFQLYFQKGNPIKACALSQKGEGARIYFKSQLEFIMPLEGSGKSIVFITLPTEADAVFGLRAEARLEILIPGIINPEEDKHACVIRDFSASGCQVVIDLENKSYKLGDSIEIKLDDEEENETVLHGTIKNKKRSNHYWKYGVQFKEESCETSCELLNRLSFDESLSRYQL
ncbi:PilZ domain-containing protein [Vibrio sp. S4M6]|uniref:PilZ domain-containing protein n=1 Tax=Vibrio sinus TaxID=2946865 RepID=UPI00202A1DD6|nr:PilZ domain-containing protein [Vibrio sinus]MCL9781796.1 PilZ domain-containing protein [Vibrio sinus]